MNSWGWEKGSNGRQWGWEWGREKKVLKKTGVVRGKKSKGDSRKKKGGETVARKWAGGGRYRGSPNCWWGGEELEKTKWGGEKSEKDEWGLQGLWEV